MTVSVTSSQLQYVEQSGSLQMHGSSLLFGSGVAFKFGVSSGTSVTKSLFPPASTVDVKSVEEAGSGISVA